MKHATEDVRALRDAIRAHENWPAGSYDWLGDLLDEVLAGRESGWRDISTAPKDGKEILVCYTRQGNVMKLVNWNRIRQCWSSKGAAEYGLEQNATHWMPLPAAPTKEKR